MKQRLDAYLVTRQQAPTRSQAENFIRLGYVRVNGDVSKKPGRMVGDADTVSVTLQAQYVSRAGLKLASVTQDLHINFRGMTVLDVGSSTGGFTDYALQHGADYVIAVDVGTNQLHPKLIGHPQIELHEQTDIRDIRALSRPVDIVVIDVSFISLREILPTVSRLITNNASVIAMVKPQFEAGAAVKHKGVIKNDRMRRDILHDFEYWVRDFFVIQNKADSDVAGAKGNRERFYVLKKLAIKA